MTSFSIISCQNGLLELAKLVHECSLAIHKLCQTPMQRFLILTTCFVMACIRLDARAAKLVPNAGMPVLHCFRAASCDQKWHIWIADDFLQDASVILKISYRLYCVSSCGTDGVFDEGVWHFANANSF